MIARKMREAGILPPKLPPEIGDAVWDVIMEVRALPDATEDLVSLLHPLAKDNLLCGPVVRLLLTIQEGKQEG